MKIYDAKYLVEYARENSPYHKELYAGLKDDFSFDDVPFINGENYWNSPLSHLTGKQTDGIVFKTGGTTSEPKYAFYSKDEWETFFMATANNLPKGGLKHGDKVANLFFAGNLYASFLYTYSMLHFSPANIIQYDFAGVTELPELAESIIKNEINVLAGLPSYIMKLMEFIKANDLAPKCKIEIIYFAGETLYDVQRQNISKILGKEISFRSVAYASNDGGYMGYFSTDCGFNEHRIPDNVCMIELLDSDTHEVITEPFRTGEIYITALYKKLMPTIRYPSGDVGEFTEPAGTPNRKFRLLGRNDKASRVGYVSITPYEIKSIVNDIGITSMGEQLIISNDTGKDKLTIYLAVEDKSDDAKEKIKSEIYKMREILKFAEDKNEIEPFELILCNLSDFEFNPRTGKTKNVIDKRKYK